MAVIVCPTHVATLAREREEGDNIMQLEAWKVQFQGRKQAGRGSEEDQ